MEDSKKKESRGKTPVEVKTRKIERRDEDTEETWKITDGQSTAPISRFSNLFLNVALLAAFKEYC